MFQLHRELFKLLRLPGYQFKPNDFLNLCTRDSVSLTRQ